MSVKPRAPKFVMPCVYRPANENVYRCKVGIHESKSGKDTRTEFRLGVDPVVAHRTAVELAEAWLAEERVWLSDKADWNEMFPGEPFRPLRWSGIPVVLAEGRETYLATPPEDLPGDQSTVAPLMPSTPAQVMTLREAMTKFLDRVRQKMTTGKRKPATYWWYERELRLGVVKGAIDPDLPLNAVDLDAFERFAIYWCDLPRRSAAAERGNFGARTAENRLNAFATFLRDTKGRRIPGYTYSDDWERALRDAMERVGGSSTLIQQYDPAVIKTILAAGDDRLRLWLYLGLNFGMTQADIGQQIKRVYNPELGGIIDIQGERYAKWWRYKMLHKQPQTTLDDGKKVPFLLIHYIWPETARLMDRFAAAVDNPHGLWLLNERGGPLWHHAPSQSRATDNISTIYNRINKQTEADLPFSQFRKFGATASVKKALDGCNEVQEMYRGERRDGSSRKYVLEDFVDGLTPFLKSWGQKLRDDGILY